MTSSSPTSIMSLHDMMEDETKPSVSDAGRPMPSTFESKMGDSDTSTTLKISEACDAVLSQQSNSSSCCSRSIGRMHPRRRSISNDEVRRRYLRRLGIAAACPGSMLNQQVGCIEVSPLNLLTKSSSHGDIPKHDQIISREERIVLLKRSVQYTTKLKSDPAEATKLSQTVGETPKDEVNGGNSTSPKSSSSKFELSSAWTSLLSKDSASITSASSPEALDGAYELFSLPSDSSITASRCDSNRSLDNILPPDRMLSRDDLSASSMPRRRKVSFDATVKAATIPSRLSYSNRIRQRLWSSTEDIYANAIRNEKEYIYDGSNWRTAREEGEHLRRSSISSSSFSSVEVLVHPVHVSGWSPSPQYPREQKRALPSSRSVGDDRNSFDQETDDENYSSEIFEMD
mmetsp:Transcript_8659/g.15057  ORF Transcript_8659/g.15057 Transcript_8659/m.15057 type:complete len:401 (+) Transcript_8659:134-1336(+)